MTYAPATFLWAAFLGLSLLTAGIVCTSTASADPPLPSGSGLAANYPGDAGIENDPNVVFMENFETGTLEQIAERWGFARHLGQMELVGDVPVGSAGTRSLRMTTTRAHPGVELYKVFDQGWDRIHFRFQVKFAEDYGLNHHFASLSGRIDPPRYPLGGAGSRPENHLSVTIEPPFRGRPPFEGQTWFFYAYWPEMRSWQTEHGEPDGRPNPFYGNNLRPAEPVSSDRGKWTTVEMMLKLNSDPSDPNNRDGEVALWVDGQLVAHFAPGVPERGYWRRDSFNASGNPPPNWLDLPFGPFEGFRWRHDEKLLINVLRLQNYVSGRTFDAIERAANQGWDFNTEEATVFFNNVVLATEYIGPMTPIPGLGASGAVNPSPTAPGRSLPSTSSLPSRR